MFFAVGQFAADADHEDRPVFAGRFRLAFPRRQRRIHFQQVFALDEPDGLRKDRRDVRIDLIHFAFHAANYTVNFSNDLFQEIEVALFGRHGAFPIPLIHVDRMQVIQLFVGADGVHVGIKTVTGSDAVSSEFHSFPLGQRMHHLGAAFTHIFDRERNRPFDAVQVVVDSRPGQHEKRRGDPAQIQFGRQRFLKAGFNRLDGLFHHLRNEFGLVLFYHVK